MADLEDLKDTYGTLASIAETDVFHVARPALGDPKDRTVTGKEIREFNATGNLNAQTGTSYQLALTDLGKVVTLDNAGAITLTVPPNATVAFPVGTMIELVQLGAGQVTITAGGGVTVNATPGLNISAQYGVAALLKIATDTWVATGALAA